MADNRPVASPSSAIDTAPSRRLSMCFVERAITFPDLGPSTMAPIELSWCLGAARDEEWEW